MGQETEIWIECDSCGKAYGGPDVFRVVQKRGDELLCTKCLARRDSVSSASRGCEATHAARGANEL
jgi:hypothetical protein